VIKGGGVDMFVVYQQIQKSLFQQSSMTDLCSRAISNELRYFGLHAGCLVDGS